MSAPFVGEIRLCGFNFAPQGWVFCRGQILPIAQNTALFSLLGTTYGGNGQTTFALPDLRGRSAMHFGQGPGLSQRALGEQGGAESVTLTANQIPAHSHAISASTGRQTSNRPTGGYQAAGNSYSITRNVTMAPTLAAAGSLPHENRSPYVGMNFIIALLGVYPPRG
jgi:microcystin-dependent protein